MARRELMTRAIAQLRQVERETMLRNIRRKTHTHIPDASFNLDPFGWLYRLFEKYWELPFTIIIDGINSIRKSVTYDTSMKTKAFESFRKMFMDGSDGWLINDTSTIRILPKLKVQPLRMVQAFATGEVHCVIHPIRELWENSTSKKRDVILKRIQKFSDKNGLKPIPEYRMESVARTFETRIRVYDPLGALYKIYNIDGKLTINFTNALQNHVDEGICEKRESVVISYEEGQELIQKFSKNGNVFICEGTMEDPYRIRTLDTTYEISNPMKPYLNEIDSLIPHVSLNAVKFPSVNRYILEGRIINAGRCAFKEEFDNHYDLEKAYSQFDKTKYYMGFLGNIHQSRTFDVEPSKEWLNNHIGIYTGVVSKTCELARKLGLIEGGEYVLPLPEWNMYRDMGVEFRITEGVFGSQFDFRFPLSAFENVKTRNGDTNKPFRIWSGTLSYENDKRHYSFKCSREFAPHIASIYPETNYNQETEIIQVSIPILSVRTRHHILAFLTSYTRIVMVQEMMKFELSNLSAVTMDGVYFTGDPPDNLIPQFRKKEFGNVKGHIYWYSDRSGIPHNRKPFPLMTDIDCSMALLGAGGTGKTQRILGDTGFGEILYVSPSHELGKQKRDEFDVIYSTFHRAIGEKCKFGESFKDIYGEPAVIFVDELTQIEGSWIDRLIEMYPQSLIFVSGDIDENGKHFQTKYSNDIWKPSLPIKMFYTDYRSKTDELRIIKENMRKFMRNDVTQYDMMMYARRFQMISVKQAVEIFEDTDVWIIGTHKYASKIPVKTMTTHSVQGKTIEPPARIFISVDDMFEYSMLYTAISRARSHTQLIFVADGGS